MRVSDLCFVQLSLSLLLLSSYRILMLSWPMAVAGLIVVVLDVSEASVGKPTLRDRGSDT
jgi:hypothetical protein